MPYSVEGLDRPESGSVAEILGNRRLLVVSNREPFEIRELPTGTRFTPTVGGLVSALDPVVRATKGSWIAWRRGEAGERPYTAAGPAEGAPYTLRVIPVSEREAGGYYDGFANRTLWPLFHGFIGRARFDDDYFSDYKRVNQRFAAAVASSLAPGDLVWIHDYQLALVPQEIRDCRDDAGKPLGIGATIAYFHHIPFPALETFRVLPWAREILRGLLGAALVGFHTSSYAENFLDACEFLLDAAIDRDRSRVHWAGRWIQVGAFPIGIDVDLWERVARKPETIAAARALKRDFRTEWVIVGADRLDYTKGLKERVLAIEKLLERHPNLRRRVTFVQVAVPSRTRVDEYKQMKRELDETIGRVNGRFSETGWSPIRYIARSLDQAKLVPLYLAADIGLVTPLRDGMNLVAMEYVASRVDGGGALVLSDQAGASERLPDAWMVNPRHLSGIADTIAEILLNTPESVRAARMAALRRDVRAGDVRQWMEGFLRQAVAAAES